MACAQACASVKAAQPVGGCWPGVRQTIPAGVDVVTQRNSGQVDAEKEEHGRRATWGSAQVVLVTARQPMSSQEVGAYTLHWGLMQYPSRHWQ